MAQQTINVGTADKGNGDPLRTAFIKVNNNFNELYAALGADFENLETHLIPSEDDTYDLGSPTKKWRSLYVGANTIYLDNTPLTVEGGVLKVNGTDVGGSDRLSQNEAELVLTGGANPYTLFPAITGGDQLIIQGAEVSSVSGHLALTSQNNLYIIANGSGAAPGGSKSWTFGDDGSLTIPGDIRSEQAINIDINLGDSTLRRWTFGEDGVLNAPASSGLYNANLFDIRSESNYTAWVRTSGQIGLASINSTGVANVAKVEAISTQPAHVDITVESSGQAPKVWRFDYAGALIFPDGTEQTTAWTGSVSSISSGPTAPGSAVVAGENDVDFNFSDGVSTAVSITRDSEVVSAKAVGLTLASNYDVKIVTDFTDNDRTWTFEGSTGDVVLPRGSIIGETTNTTVITPPTASPGQSLVIRPTASQWTIESSGFIVYGSPITITLTLQSWTYFGTVNYEITGTGVTEQTLGRAVTGKLTYAGVVGGPDAQSVTWTIPAQSTITEFTFTITGVDGTASTGPSETDPALYYNFEFNALPTGYSTTVTNNGISNTEISHIHLVAGDPVNTDLYLGDDDQYVKIEKNAGDVVIGTNANTKNWTFGNDGNLTLPGELHGSPVISGGMFPSQVGRTVNITPADDASDKKFKFRIDQYGETFTRAYFDMPEAEIDKQVAATFPHANNTVGYIFTQGTNINDDGLNNAFNIFYNSGNIKITAMETGGTGTLRTWKFGNDGILTLPNSTTIGNDLAGEYSSSFLCSQWGVSDQTSGLFSSNSGTRPIFDPLIATVTVGWYVSGPGLTGVKEITDIVELGDGDRAFIVDLTDGSLWSDLSVNIPYRFYSSDYVLTLNGTKLTVNSNEWKFNQAGHLTVPGDIHEKVGNDLEIAVHNNRNNDGTPGSAVLSLTNNDAVDFQTYTTLEVGAYGIKLNTDYEGVFTGARRTWEFKRDNTLTFPGGATVKDLPGEGLDDSVLILGAGTTIAENQRAARIGINGSVEGVSIGAGSNDWTFTNDGTLTLPNNSQIRVDGNNVEVGGMTNFNVEALGVVNVYTNDGAHQWQFGDDGRLYLPSIGSGGGAILRSPLNESIGISAYNDTGAGATYTLSVATTGPINIPTASTGLGRLQNADGIEILTNSGETAKLWAFGNDGSLTLPFDNKITVGGDMDTNSINFVLQDSLDPQTTFEFAFDASMGMPLLRFPDGSLQSTAWTGNTKTIQSVTVTTPTAITADVVFGDPNAAGGNVNLVLPVAPENGTVITVKNINAGGNSVFVQTNGIDNMETEAGTIGSGVYATIAGTGDFITWIYQSSTSTYRIIG